MPASESRYQKQHPSARTNSAGLFRANALQTAGSNSDTNALKSNEKTEKESILKKILVFIVLLYNLSSGTATLTHSYTFNAGVGDSVGSPALVDNGGSVINGRYHFSPDQGLALNNGLLDTASYSIEMVFQLNELLSFYMKLIDFQNLAADQGLYVLTNALDFYSGTIGTDLGFAPISAGVDVSVVLTRSANGETQSYLNGVMQSSEMTTDSLSEDDLFLGSPGPSSEH